MTEDVGDRAEMLLFLCQKVADDVGLDPIEVYEEITTIDPEYRRPHDDPLPDLDDAKQYLDSP